MSKFAIVLATTALFGLTDPTFADKAGTAALTRGGPLAQATAGSRDHRRGVKEHRVAIQVDQNDPDVMNLALNNAKNVIEHYRGRGEKVDVEIVAYGPGLHMLRADT